jgi:tetratricopeptide (TPR) repeat protein
VTPDPDATVPGEAPRFEVRPAGMVEVPGFEIRGEIHRGGQGVVWRALQRSTRREVALKTLLSGSFASERERRLFEREIETVASLRHPNLVTLYESGVAPGGELWFAMELVEGRPLGAATPASFRARVQMLAKIARAVAQAHRRGVIHRDLKPANVLVDGSNEPKVLDFGIARTAADSADERSGEFLGTAAYAAPEQVRGEVDAIDVRTDVFALGLIGYELLADARPFADAKTREELLAALRREPVPPSARSAALRRELGVLADDLDAIVAACLAGDPAGRYQSAGELADDLDRCLAGFPVRARGDAIGYLAGKFIRRHRVASSLAAGLLVLVAASAASLAVLYARAERNRARAEATLAAFRETMLAADPEIGRGSRDLTVLEYFDGVADAALREPKIDPLVASVILNTVEGIHLAFEDRDRPLERLERARDVGVEARREGGPAGVEAEAEALRNLGRHELLHGRLEAARDRYLVALFTLERNFGLDDPRNALTMQHLASTLRRLGDLDGAESLYARVLAIQERSHGPDSDEVAAAINGRAWVRRGRGDRDGALADFERARSLVVARHGPDDYRAARALSQIAGLKLELGRVDGAVADLESALATIEERKGPDAATTLETRLALAEALLAADRPADAKVQAGRVATAARASGETSLADRAEAVIRAAAGGR